MKKIDEYALDYACDDACVKVANYVKSVKKCQRQGKDAPKGPQEHLRAPTYRRERGV